MLQRLTDRTKENGFRVWKNKGTSKQFPAGTVTDPGYLYDPAFLAHSPAQAKFPSRNMEKATRDINLYTTTDKAKSICFDQNGPIFSFNSKLLKSVKQSIHLGGNSSSTESDGN